MHAKYGRPQEEKEVLVQALKQKTGQSSWNRHSFEHADINTLVNYTAMKTKGDIPQIEWVNGEPITQREGVTVINILSIKNSPGTADITVDMD